MNEIKKKIVNRSKKNTPWNKQQIRREVILYKNDTLRIAKYAPSQESYSTATELIRCINKEHRGGAGAFLTVMIFLSEMNPDQFNFNRMYVESLKMAMDNQITGRVHYDTKRLNVTSVKDIERLLEECLRASNIYEITTKKFVKHSLSIL